ncbi:MAG: phenylacetate--CoA ligase family protein [Solirubrobacterales bacterium]|nr:phenylacetate--CoA ligase family protein [Solirubrobacterales bacterium]
MSAQRSGASVARRAAWSARLAIRGPLEARFPFRSPEAIERAQRGRLRESVDHAFAHVPYYREAGKRLGLGPADFQAAGDLAKLPLIERDQLQADPEYFVSEAEPLERYVELRSGGGGGEPVTVYWDRRSLVLGGAHRERLRALTARLAASRLRPRMARLAAPLDSSRQTSRAFSGSSLLPASLRYASLELSMLDPMDANVEALNEFRPDVIACFGSGLEALFVHLRESGQPFLAPSVVTYGADPLSERMRRLISDDFGIEVLSVYSAIEAFQIAFECERHTGLHVNADLSALRIVDPERGESLPPGESGEVVVSNLVNRATILLNYRLGDIAAALPGSCPCGRRLPLLSQLEARSDDLIETASGELLHPQRIRAPLTSEPAVLRYQVLQLGPGLLRVEVVTDRGADDEALCARLARTLAEPLGGGGSVEVAAVPTLPRSDRGKVRPVMSLQARERLQRERG